MPSFPLTVPNQPLQPSHSAVTPRAGARVAPAGGRLNGGVRHTDEIAIALVRGGRFVLTLGAVVAASISLPACRTTGCDTGFRDNTVVERCEVHGVETEWQQADVIYGLMAFKKAYVCAKARYFPNSNLHWYGGCEKGSLLTISVRVCPRCRAAELEWRRSHRESLEW